MNTQHFVSATRLCVVLGLFTLLAMGCQQEEVVEQEGLRPDERVYVIPHRMTTTPAYPVINEPIMLNVEIMNMQSVGVEHLQIDAYANRDIVFRDSVSIKPFSSVVQQIPWLAKTAGTYEITIKLDGTGQFAEAGYIGKDLTHTVVIASDPGVEGEFELVALQTQKQREGPDLLSAIVRNNGDFPSDTRVKLASDSLVLEDIYIPMLLPGKQDTVSVLLPAALLPGVYSAEINPGLNSHEPNPNDNKKTLDLRQELDLTVSNVSIQRLPESVAENSSVSVSFRITNTGKQDIDAAFATRVQIDSTEQNAYYLNTDYLESGKSILVHHTFDSTPDSFDVSIVADVNRTIAEPNVDNNKVVFPHGPDFSIPERWYSIGPFNIYARPSDAWSEAVGRLHEIAVHPTITNTMYVGSPAGTHFSGGGSGVWKTTNGGSTWQPISDALPSLTIIAMTMDPSSPSTLYIATPEGIFRTDDAGASWLETSTIFSLGLRDKNETLLVDPSDSQILYLTSNKGVLKSVDRGVNWSLLNIPGGMRRASSLVINPANPNVLYASMRHGSDSNLTGFYVSYNKGNSWTKMTGCSGGSLPSIPPNSALRLAASGSKLYASVKTPDSWTLYYTTELSCSIGGQRQRYWTKGWAPTGTIDEQNIHRMLWSGIYADPVDQNYVYAGGTYFWRSTDGGKTFELSSGKQYPAGGAHVDHQGFAVNPLLTSVIFTVGDGGIYKSIRRGEPGSWTFEGAGIANVEFYDIADAKTNPTMVIGGTQDNGTLVTRNGSLFWTEVRGGDGANSEVDASTASRLYAGGQNIDIFKSENGGNTFISTRSDVPENCFNPFYQLHPSFTSLLIESCESLWVGLPWSSVFTPPEGRVLKSAIDPEYYFYYVGTSEGDIWVAPSAGLPPTQSDFFKISIGLSKSPILDIEIDPSDDSVIYVSKGNANTQRIYQLKRLVTNPSSPSSFIITDITSNLPIGLEPRALAVDIERANVVYVGTNRGVYKGIKPPLSTSWNWTRFSAGLPEAVSITELEIHPITGRLRAATSGRSAYESRPIPFQAEL